MLHLVSAYAGLVISRLTTLYLILLFLPCRAGLYGQVSKELAEPYYLYGRALLELSRGKNAMFGAGIPGG